MYEKMLWNITIKRNVTRSEIIINNMIVQNRILSCNTGYYKREIKNFI